MPHVLCPSVSRLFRHSPLSSNIKVEGIENKAFEEAVHCKAPREQGRWRKGRALCLNPAFDNRMNYTFTGHKKADFEQCRGEFFECLAGG